MSTKFASLHAGLVARKGEAMPAITNPSMSYVDQNRNGWDQSRPLATVSNTAVADRMLSIRSFTETDRSAPEPEDGNKTRPQVKPAIYKDNTDHHARPYRLTFRMGHNQRRRLRLVSAQTDQSLQHVLSDALDKYLDGLCACSLKECACLRHQENSPD